MVTQLVTPARSHSPVPTTPRARIEKPTHAIVITTLGEARTVELTDDGHHAEIRHILGGSPDRAVYHREALLWVHGNGAGESLPSNLPAWTLARAWRGLTLDHQLFGDVVITGRGPDGDAEPLSADLSAQARRYRDHPRDAPALAAEGPRLQRGRAE